MKNKKLRAAVIGIGNMGANHVRTYNNIDEVELVAIADLNKKLGKETAEEYGIKYFESYNEMLEKMDLDIVSIVVPTRFHFPVTKDCIKAGVHTLLEKPITVDPEDGIKLIELANKKNVKLLVGHIERFNPAVQKVKSMIDNGDLGDITALTTRRIGGLPPQIQDDNIVIDLAIHDIDIANYLIGSLPNDVSMHTKRNHLEQRADSVEVFMKYNNVSAYVQTNWISPVKIRKLSITGSEGYLEMDYITQKIEFYKSNYSKFKDEISNYSDYIMRFADPDKIDISVGKKEPLKEEMLYLINAINNHLTIDSTFAVDSLKIALLQDNI